MHHAATSRRNALAFLLGSWRLLRGTPAAGSVRLALSESLVGDVNMNDARAAMSMWLKEIGKAIKFEIEISPKIFDTSEEIMSRARSGGLDAAGLNVLEYRQIAEYLDPSQIVTPSPGSGLERYVLLAKRESGSAQLAHLHGRRLCVLKGPRMCVAPAWIRNMLDAAHLGLAEHFFASITMEAKMPRVILPVFFGQTDACITTKASFDTMCEMNPQVGASLQIVAMSAPMVLTFYIFRKDNHTAFRNDFSKVLSEFQNNTAGRQLATLFQFDQLVTLDGHCLESALTELETADRRQSTRGVGAKGAL